MLKIIYAALFMAGSTITLSSCTKDLKDDARQMNEELKKLRAQNDSLQSQNGKIRLILGTDEPMKITTNCTNNEGQATTFNKIYRFKSDDYTSQYMSQNPDGSYDILLVRYPDVIMSEEAVVRFTYHPGTKQINNKDVRHYWSTVSREFYMRFNDTYGKEGLTLNIDVESLDLTTGEIAVKVNAAGTGKYTGSAPSPFPGKPIDTTLSFKGKLKLLTKG